MVWTRHGECNDCGHCCQYIGDRIHQVPLGNVEDVTYLRARGYTIGTDTARLRVFMHSPCPEHHDDRCRIYENRPSVCAGFPTNPRQIVHTPCSYWFEDENGQKVGGSGSPHVRTSDVH